MEKAVFYARVSTDKEDQLNSVELQIEENRKAISANNWDLADQYIDRGKSGTRVKGRDEYQRLLDDMELDKFDIVVAKDQERLQRNTKDWYIFVDRLVQTGKRLYLYLDHKFYTPDDVLITGIRAIIAEDFSRNLSKKLRNFNDGRIEKAKAGDKDILLQGIGKAYGWDQKDGVITLNPEQSRVRRLMCELTLQGKGSTEVAKILNDEGYRNTVGNEWKTTDIPRMVYSYLNVGTVILNQKRHDFEAKRDIYTDPSEWVYLDDAIPPIVTKEEWEQLQQIRKQRTTVDRARGKKAGKSVFSGKIICACCGKPYWRKLKHENNQEFWVCSTKQTKGRKTRARDAVAGQKGEINEGGCDNTNISTEALMGILQEATAVLSADTELIKADRIKWLQGLRKQLLEANNCYTEEDLKREQSRKDKLLSGFLDGFVSGSDYAEKSKLIDEKIELIKKDLKADEGKLEDIAEIDRVLDNIDEEIAVYLDENKQLKIECILSEMSEVVIYPDAVRLNIPSFSRDLLVKRFQYVKDRNSRKQLDDRALYGHALSPVQYTPAKEPDPF